MKYRFVRRIITFVRIIGKVAHSNSRNFDFSSMIAEGSDASITINTLNLHSLALAFDNRRFSRALLSSQVLICDGFWLRILVKLLRPKSKVFHFTGFDLLTRVIIEVEGKSSPILFLGGSDESLRRISRGEFDQGENVLIKAYSEQLPFVHAYNEGLLVRAQEIIKGFDEVNYIMIGIGAPKQELLARDLALSTSGKAFFSIGAAANFFTNVEVRAPFIFRWLGMEWLWRLGGSRGKTWRRVFISPLKVGYVLLSTLFMITKINKLQK